PKQSLCGNSMAEAWRSQRLAPVNFFLPARTRGAGGLSATPQIPDRDAAATARSMSALVDRRRLGEESLQHVVATGVILLVGRGVRDARHDGELLVGVG